MEFYTYQIGDFKKATSYAQWVFFVIDKESIEIIGGIGQYNSKENTINIYEYDLNNCYVGGKLKSKINVSINDFNELQYIGRQYIKIYGSVDKINENEGEIVNLFDNYIKSKTVYKYAEKHLKLKNNNWTINILKELPVPTRFTAQTTINALNKLENKLFDNEIENQIYKHELKFLIPLGISILSLCISIVALCC